MQTKNKYLKMYEKNCLTYSCLKHIEQSPYTIVLQMHPSASQEKKEFMQKLYEIETNVKLQHISVKSVKKQSFSWAQELLKTVKGPCSILCVPSLLSLQNVLKVLVNSKTAIPCTVISVSYENKLLTAPQIQILAKDIAKPENILLIKNVPQRLCNLWLYSIQDLIYKMKYKANNGN